MGEESVSLNTSTMKQSLTSTPFLLSADIHFSTQLSESSSTIFCTCLSTETVGIFGNHYMMEGGGREE